MATRETQQQGHRSVRKLGALLVDDGWEIQRSLKVGDLEADLQVSKGKTTYVVEVKAGAEGRPDRVIAQLAQAILQAQHYSRLVRRARPLAVVHVRAATRQLVSKVQDFHRTFAPDVAVGLIADNGIRYFAGEGLEALSSTSAARSPRPSPSRTVNLFSDLNQWMLKVLLAAEIPERFLRAPRQTYRNVSELAAAADVSVMSAFRFAARLREEGFLDESRGTLVLVRRKELFRRWHAAASRSTPELKLAFVLRATAQSRLAKVLTNNEACLGAFAAADRLGIGHVSGVPPHAFVARIEHPSPEHWKGLAVVEPGETPQLIVKQALAPESMFRGAVSVDGVHVTDVLQIWLDVAAHPSRGPEQAERVQRLVIDKLLSGVT